MHLEANVILRNCHVITHGLLDDRARVSSEECTARLWKIPINILAQESGKVGSAISTVTPRFGRARQGQTY